MRHALLRNASAAYALLAGLNLSAPFFGGPRSSTRVRRGRNYDTVRPEVRKAWACRPGDLEGRAKALSRG